MGNIIRFLSQRQTFEICLFAGLWCSMFGVTNGFTTSATSIGLTICAAAFVAIMLLSFIVCGKKVGYLNFFIDAKFSLFSSVTTLLWLAAMFGWGSGNDEVRTIVANGTAFVLLAGLVIIALAPRKYTFPD